MRILILDDQEVRHLSYKIRYAEHQVVSVYKYSEFLEQLSNGSPWDLIHLDHDLDHCVDDPDTYVDGWGKTQAYNGAHAAMRVCEMDMDKYPKLVIVQSINPSGAEAIVDMLTRAGIETLWQPFGSNK